MSVVPELELPLEAFKERGITTNDVHEKVAVDGKAKCVVDREVGGEVVTTNNSAEEKNSQQEEVFKEGPSEKGCSNDGDFEGEGDERGMRGRRKKLLSFSDEVQHQQGGEKRGKYEEEELRRRKDSDRRREEEGAKEEEGRKRREDRRRRSCQVNTGEFSEGMPCPQSFHLLAPFGTLQCIAEVGLRRSNNMKRRQKKEGSS